MKDPQETESPTTVRIGLNQINNLIEAMAELKDAILVQNSKLEKQQQQLEQIRYSAALEMQTEYSRKVTLNQLSFLETLEKISDRKMSLARFGDGELALTAHENRSIAFQKGSYQLTRRLRGVMNANGNGLLVALPTTVIDVYWMTSFARYWSILRDIIPSGHVWGVSVVTRAYAMKTEGQKLVDAWRACWEDRSVTVVTGEGSRFEALPELFSNVRDMEFIYGPARNSFEHLDKITQKVCSKPRDLVLIALGPAGTVLAADLHARGIQALDVGHLSNGYQEAFQKGPKPETLPIVQP